MRHALLITALVACGNGGPSGSNGSGASATASSPGGIGSSGSTSATGSARATGSAASAVTTPQVSVKVIAARCDEPCLFLVDTAFADLATAYKTACGKPTPELGFDDCATLDLARNCIFAAHGKVYRKKQWKRLFDHKSWYAADPAFKESAFTAIETANVKELYHRGKACKRGVHISAADDHRLATWFTAFAAHATNAKRPAPPLPSVIIDSHGEPVDRPAFLSQLDDARGAYLDLPATGSGGPVRNGELAYRAASKSYLSFDSDAFDNDVMSKLSTALPDRSKLRMILVDFDLRDSSANDNPVNEGVYVYFVYDATNRLVAISFSTYLLD